MSQRNERATRPNLSGVSHWLIHQAAQRAPEAVSSRLEEEWRADLESRSAALSRLSFAAGCCWASLVIANDYPRNTVTPAVAAAPANELVTLVDRNFGYFSLRSATLFLIAGLHAALFYGLIASLSHTHRARAPDELQNQPVKSELPKKAPFALSAPERNRVIRVPKANVDPPARLNFANDLTIDVSDRPREVISRPPLPESPSRTVQRMAGGPGAGFPDAADFYPSPSIRLGEEGLTTVQVCVDTKGRLTSAPTTLMGSGIARLDGAALRLARAGSGHYRAGTEDGQPVTSCYPLAVRFQLKK